MKKCEQFEIGERIRLTNEAIAMGLHKRHHKNREFYEGVVSNFHSVPDILIVRFDGEQKQTVIHRRFLQAVVDLPGQEA